MAVEGGAKAPVHDLDRALALLAEGAEHTAARETTALAQALWNEDDPDPPDDG